MANQAVLAEASARTHAEQIQEVRDLLQDSFRHRAWIYWLDLGASVAVTYAALALVLWAPAFGPAEVALFGVAGIGLFRVASFIHEIQHIPARRLRAFKIAWNVLCGIPFLMPSNLYDNHVDHHSSRHYGTARDGEYLPLGRGPLWRLVVYAMQVPVLPLLAVFRFGVLVPLSFLHPRLRRVLRERASSYGINLRYVRETRPGAPWRIAALADLAGFVYVIVLGGLAAAGVLSLAWLARFYAVAVFAIGLNWLRNLVAHRYRNDGGPMGYLGQLEDSVTIQGRPLVTELLFPLGLRYHSLHHLLPGIPYHELGRAHRRLMAELPAGAAYRRTVYPNVRTVLRGLVADARAGARRPGPVGAWPAPGG